MEFKSLDRKVMAFLPRRSLCIMSDEARYGWTHGISERKSDLVDNTVLKRGLRVSLTLRRVRTQPCTCQYKALCDSWLADPSSALLPAGQQLEEAHVHDVYVSSFSRIVFM
jgi:alkylated DNA repair protein alkB family protein 8